MHKIKTFIEQQGTSTKIKLSPQSFMQVTSPTMSHTQIISSVRITTTVWDLHYYHAEIGSYKYDWLTNFQQQRLILVYVASHKDCSSEHVQNVLLLPLNQWLSKNSFRFTYDHQGCINLWQGH